MGLPAKDNKKSRSQKEQNRIRAQIVDQSHDDVEIIKLNDLGPIMDMQDDEKLRGPRRRVSQEDTTT